MSAEGCVYFIQAGKDGPVKIGHTTGNPRERLQALQTGNNVELKMVALVPGGKDLEQAFHRVFECWRMRGEWFAPMYAILAWGGWDADQVPMLSMKDFSIIEPSRGERIGWTNEDIRIIWTGLLEGERAA